MASNFPTKAIRLAFWYALIVNFFSFMRSSSAISTFLHLLKNAQHLADTFLDHRVLILRRFAQWPIFGLFCAHGGDGPDDEFFDFDWHKFYNLIVCIRW